MRILVVYAHPLRESFAASLHGAILESLQGRGHDIDDLDLFAEGFDPVLPAEERAHYEDEAFPRAIDPHIARLRAAEAIVLCFPTWWYGMPAILKGWFDRVWIPGVAFRLPEGGGMIVPALTHIRYFAVVTTYGSPWWFIRLVLRDPVRAVTMGGFRRLLSPKVRVDFLAFYNIDGASAASRARFLERVRRHFVRI